MVAHTFKPSTREAKAGGSPVLGHAELKREILSQREIWKGLRLPFCEQHLSSPGSALWGTGFHLQYKHTKRQGRNKVIGEHVQMASRDSCAPQPSTWGAARVWLLLFCKVSVRSTHCVQMMRNCENPACHRNSVRINVLGFPLNFILFSNLFHIYSFLCVWAFSLNVFLHHVYI